MRCQHGNAKLEFMRLQPKGREKQWHQTNDAWSKASYARFTPRNGLKEKFLRVPELCLSALICLQLFGQVHLCSQLSKREEMKKKKPKLHIAFRNCSQRKSGERQSETSSAVKLNKAFREFYVPVKSNPWLITSI